MKKFFAMMIALIMMLSCAVFAEEAINFEELYEGAWTNFEDDGFQMYLPTDWIPVEIDEETMSSTGTYYLLASPDFTRTFQVAWKDLGIAFDMEVLLADITLNYPEAVVMNVGNYEAVVAYNETADFVAFSVLSADGMELYTFSFTPASDEEMLTLASAMMSSLTPVEAAA